MACKRVQVHSTPQRAKEQMLMIENAVTAQCDLFTGSVLKFKAI